MLEASTKSDIEKISYDLLKQSKSFDIFPTPVDELVNFSDLVVSKEVNLAQVNESFFSRISDKFTNLVHQVRGVLDRREKIIYLDLNQSVNRKNFVKLHETGHNILEWQTATLEFLDNDETLDPDLNEQFEAEANYFASATLFQLDRFDSEISNLPLGLNAVKHLSKQFGASIHATYRRYVEKSHKRCSLLILEKISGKNEFCQCQVRNYFQSASFTKEFGIIKWETSLGYTWDFVQKYYFGRRYIVDGEISLPTAIGNIECTYHFFNNTYNAFVFFYPKGEKIKSRTKFIVEGI